MKQRGVFQIVGYDEGGAKEEPKVAQDDTISCRALVG